jgi:hypothetical protein
MNVLHRKAKGGVWILGSIEEYSARSKVQKPITSSLSDELRSNTSLTNGDTKSWTGPFSTKENPPDEYY